MFLMYVDESGDCGLTGSPSRYFILCGLVVHELRWEPCLGQLIQFRQQIRQQFGLRLREEIHSAAMINRPGDLVRIPRNDRLTIIRLFAELLGSMCDFSLINIVVDKHGKQTNYDVFENAWRALIQRFENTIRYRNFPGPANPDERGLIFPDPTDVRKLTRLVRQMRRFNPIPNQSQIGYRNLPLAQLIEDPSFRDSKHSFFIQAADLAAYLLYQNQAPNAYIRRRGAQNYYQRLTGIYCRQASTSHPLGIVQL